MKFVGVAEAKTKFSELLRKSKDEEIIVTSRGKPKVLIQNIEEEDFEDFIITHSKKIEKRIENAWEAYKKGEVIELEEVKKIVEGSKVPVYNPKTSGKGARQSRKKSS